MEQLRQPNSIDGAFADDSAGRSDAAAPTAAYARIPEIDPYGEGIDDPIARLPEIGDGTAIEGDGGAPSQGARRVDATSGASYEMLEMRWPGNDGAPDGRTASRRPSRSATIQPRTATYIVAACVALLVAFTVLGSVLNVGDHLMAAHPVLGWAFYLLLVVVVAVGIVYPVVEISRRPVFSLYQLRDEQGHAKARRCRMLVDNLVANTDLTDEEVAVLEGYLLKGDEADDLLISFFNERCVPQIEAETKHAATTAFFASAISRSPLIATVTMLSVCLDLVRAIVERCGFRPTNLGLARLYGRIMLSALVAGGIEDSDLSDLLATMMGGGAGARVGGIVLGSATEGIVSAFLVFRVGVITKDWLTSADGPAKMSSIRRVSYREALALMRTSGFMNTVADVIKRNVGNMASSTASSIAGAAKSAAESTVTAVATAGGNAAETLAHAASATVEAAAGAAEGAAQMVRRTAGSAREATASFFDRAKNLLLPRR